MSISKSNTAKIWVFLASMQHLGDVVFVMRLQSEHKCKILGETERDFCRQNVFLKKSSFAVFQRYDIIA